MMSPEHHRSRHRRRVAKIYLTLILLGLSGANALLLRFAFHRMNPWPVLQGYIVGAAITSILLLFAIWQREAWARYVLIAFLWFNVAVFGVTSLVVMDRGLWIERGPLAALLGALAIYVAANALLICSRKIQHLSQRASSGG